MALIRAMDFTGEPKPRQRRETAKVEHAANEVKVLAEPLSPVWWQGREWAVTSYGIEKRDGTYYIPVADFGMHEHMGWSWPEHLAAKGWADVEDFTTAWLVALTLHGAGGKRHRNVISKLPPVGGQY